MVVEQAVRPSLRRRNRPCRNLRSEGRDATASYAGLSLWHETTPTDWTPRPALDGDVEADVAIVGAGYTGLWTAYYLSRADPSLRVVVVEAEVAGFGASGRNGGWCSALFPTSLGEAQDAAMRALGRRGRTGEPRRGHRLPLRQGRHHRAGPQPGPAGPRPGRAR